MTDRKPLAQARAVADLLVSYLAPACERIEIAGSIRREVPEVKDIELVAIPRWEEIVAPPATSCRTRRTS